MLVIFYLPKMLYGYEQVEVDWFGMVGGPAVATLTAGHFY